MKRSAMTIGVLLLGFGLVFGQTDGRKQLTRQKSVVQMSTMPEALSARRTAMQGQVAAGHSVAAKVADNVKFMCDFNNADTWENDWILVDGDHSDISWQYFIGEVGASYDEDPENGYIGGDPDPIYGAGNYLLTKNAVTMPAGKAYVGLYYRVSDPDLTEKLKIYYAKTKPAYTEESMDVSTMTLIDSLETNRLDWSFGVWEFTVAEAGDYYFCFHHCTNNPSLGGEILYLDDIEVGSGEFSGEPDLTIKQVVLPNSACGLGQERVGAMVRNTGRMNINAIKLSYAVDGGAKVEQAFDFGDEVLASGDAKTLYFDGTADFSTQKAYDVRIEGTVTAYDGQAETEMGNNHATGRVTNFTPVAELPWQLDLAEKDNCGQLGYDPNIWVYSDSEKLIWAQDTMPMTTRCIKLEANTKYRFSYDYGCGFSWAIYYFVEDFAVLYGKPGTPVSTWTVLKYYKDEYTDDMLVRGEVMFTNEEAGEYSFAFLPCPNRDENQMLYEYNGSLAVSYMELEKVSPNDVKIAAIRTTLAAKTPSQHAVAPVFEVKVVNRGAQTDKVTVRLMAGETEIGVSAAQSIVSGDTATYTIKGKLDKPDVGKKVNLTVLAENAEDPTPEDNKKTWSFMPTDKLYAFDDAEKEYTSGLSTSKYRFGTIFTVAAKDTLKGIQLGLADVTGEGYEDGKVGLAIYIVSDDWKSTTDLVWEGETVRPGKGGKAVDLEIPALPLKAGQYLVLLKQIDKYPVAVGYDMNPDGEWYAMLDNIVVRMTGYGFMAVRALFSGSQLTANEQTVDLSRYVKSYPNPATDVWTVTAYDLQIDRVEIYNMTGALMFRSADKLATEAYRVYVGDFTPGFYTARVYTNGGVQTLKVVVR